MAVYRRSAYGSHDPNAGYPANGNFAAWGGHLYPHGVPSRLLGQTSYHSQSSGQTLQVVMRKELVPLWQLAFEIIDTKHHYPVWAYRGGEPWGPWGYENRAISGTNYPSGHSAALSVDINAPFNPYSRVFVSNMPPPMVADLESLGLYWGGRYEGQKYDAMHFGFCRRPSAVPVAIARAKVILGRASTTPRPPKPPKPKPPVEVDVTPDECRKVVQEELKKFFTVDVVKVVGDAMSDPQNYDSTRDKVAMRTLRVASVTGSNNP